MIFCCLSACSFQLSPASRFNTGKICCLSRMCYVDRFIVMLRSISFESNNDTIRVYQEHIGDIVKEWGRCHVSSSFLPFETEGKRYLLEGCSICHVIRGYDIPQFVQNILCEHISPCLMCMGPGSSIFVFQRGHRCLEQMRYSRGKFQLDDLIAWELQNMVGMCFSQKNGIIIVLHDDMKTITGFHLDTKQVTWQHTEIQFGFPSQALDIIKDVSSLPDGRVCIYNHKNVFALDPRDGVIMYKLLDFDVPGIIWTMATCCH